MAEKNWDKELAKVDKQLASLSDEELLGSAAPTPPVVRSADAGRPSAKAASPAPASTGKPTKSWAVYGRLGLVLATGAAMAIWPYPSQCGAGLAGYLAAVGVVVAGGLWSSIWTWRHRAARSHTLSLLVLLWGLVLGAMQVLPRIGYAKPDLNHPPTWLCQ